MPFKLGFWSQEKNKQVALNQPARLRRKYLSFPEKWLPRTELWILIVGLACTAWGKLIIVKRHTPPNVLSALVYVVLPDVLFFLIIFLAIFGLYLLKPSNFAARCALILAVLVFAWSAFNVGWLIASGVRFPIPLFLFAYGRGWYFL